MEWTHLECPNQAASREVRFLVAGLSSRAMFSLNLPVVLPSSVDVHTHTPVTGSKVGECCFVISLRNLEFDMGQKRR